jgi:hypothetical protein
MTAEELRKWVDGQVAALIECGVDPLDAENTMKRVLAKLPEGEDPRTWIPPVTDADAEISEADIADARADWYATAPPKYARLLDAAEIEDVDA